MAPKPQVCRPSHFSSHFLSLPQIRKLEQMYPSIVTYWCLTICCHSELYGPPHLDQAPRAPLNLRNFKFSIQSDLTHLILKFLCCVVFSTSHSHCSVVVRILPKVVSYIFLRSRNSVFFYHHLILLFCGIPI